MPTWLAIILAIIGMIVMGSVNGEYRRLKQEQRRGEQALKSLRSSSRAPHSRSAMSSLPPSTPPLTSMPSTTPNPPKPDPGGVRLDPNWEWTFIPGVNGRPDQWLKGRCKHLNVVAVQAVDGSIPSQLCKTCNTQFNVPIPTE